MLQQNDLQAALHDEQVSHGTRKEFHTHQTPYNTATHVNLRKNEHHYFHMLVS